ncbi:MAG: DUF2806 domain-containing protein [Alphaproteobacteria bacterium]
MSKEEKTSGALINIDMGNIGDYSKSATVLFEKVSAAVGGIAGPWQIKRVAKAEADAEIIRAKARIEIAEVEIRGLQRLVREEGIKQKNIEDITAKAIPHLSVDAKPEELENDWLAHFFDRCRLVSNEEMQSLWAKILSGQANKPGAFSKRTIDLVATFSKEDAQLFSRLCSFVWKINGALFPLVLNLEHQHYKLSSISFSHLTHLDDIGLIKFENLAGFVSQQDTKHMMADYFGAIVIIEIPNQRREKYEISIGKVLLTQAGQELANICESLRSEEHFSYVLKTWFDRGYCLSSLLPLK